MKELRPSRAKTAIVSANGKRWSFSMPGAGPATVVSR